MNYFLGWGILVITVREKINVPFGILPFKWRNQLLCAIKIISLFYNYSWTKNELKFSLVSYKYLIIRRVWIHLRVKFSTIDFKIIFNPINFLLAKNNSNNLRKLEKYLYFYSKNFNIWQIMKLKHKSYFLIPSWSFLMRRLIQIHRNVPEAF